MMQIKICRCCCQRANERMADSAGTASDIRFAASSNSHEPHVPRVPHAPSIEMRGTMPSHRVAFLVMTATISFIYLTTPIECTTSTIAEAEQATLSTCATLLPRSPPRAPLTLPLRYRSAGLQVSSGCELVERTRVSRRVECLVGSLPTSGRTHCVAARPPASHRRSIRYLSVHTLTHAGTR